MSAHEIIERLAGNGHVTFLCPCGGLKLRGLDMLPGAEEHVRRGNCRSGDHEEAPHINSLGWLTGWGCNACGSFHPVTVGAS